MRAVIQRVSSASVTIDHVVTAAIGPGLLTLLGVQAGDRESDATWLAQKIAALRVFEDDAGKMNRSLLDQDLPTVPADGEAPGSSGADAPRSQSLTTSPVPPKREALVVSQFTLIASTRKGARPSFNDAAKPADAVPLYEAFVRQMGLALGRPVATGTFGAAMHIALVNDGPVTLIIDSRLRE